MLKKRIRVLHTAVREVAVNVIRRAQILEYPMLADFILSLE